MTRVFVSMCEAKFSGRTRSSTRICGRNRCCWHGRASCFLSCTYSATSRLTSLMFVIVVVVVHISVWLLRSYHWFMFYHYGSRCADVCIEGYVSVIVALMSLCEITVFIVWWMTDVVTEQNAVCEQSRVCLRFVLNSHHGCYEHVQID